jgi:hypothetical protein
VLKSDHTEELARAWMSFNEKIPATTTRVLALPPGPNRRIETEVNGEKIVVRNWPAETKDVVVAEFHQ